MLPAIFVAATAIAQISPQIDPPDSNRLLSPIRPPTDQAQAASDETPAPCGVKRTIVLVDINAKGLVDNASIRLSSGSPALDNAAIEASRKGRFKPYTRGGTPQPARALIPFDFVMNSENGCPADAD
jgi:TonB family protein